MWPLLVLPLVAFAQDSFIHDSTATAQNADNFRRLYSIATRIMELSGSIMGQNPGSAGTSLAASGVRSFESDNTVTGGTDSNSELSQMRRNLGFMAFPAGAPTASATPPRQGGIQGLLNTFFGSSVDESEPLPTPPTPRPRRTNLLGLLVGPPSQQSPRASTSSAGQINLWELFGVTRPTTTTTLAPLEGILNAQMGNAGAQNIDALLNALLRSNAQPARSQQIGTSSLLSQFLGKKR